MEQIAVCYQESLGAETQRLYRANILDYISYLRTVKQLSNRSVNSKLAALHSFNAYLISASAQTDVVLDKQDYLKVQQQFANPSTVSKQQVEEFRQKILVMRGKRDYAIVTLLAYAGLRISEALDLSPRTLTWSPVRWLSAQARGTNSGWYSSAIKLSMPFRSIYESGRATVPIYLSAEMVAAWIAARSTVSLSTTPTTLRPTHLAALLLLRRH